MMALNQQQRANEFSISLLSVDDSRKQKKPIHKIPDSSWGKLCFKSVSIPVFGACFIIAAILTTSILLLQNYVPYFKSYWIQWYYVDDFHLSQIYTTQNDTHIDYNNKSLLNRTIFNYGNKANKEIKMFDYFEIVIELNTEEMLDEINLTLEFVGTNQSSVTEELDISAVSEFYARGVYYNGDWYKLHTDYNLSNNGRFIDIVFAPEKTSCHFFKENGCYTSNKYRIKIRNQLKNNGFYDVLNLTLKSHKHQLYKIESAIFCIIFGILSLLNIYQWIKIYSQSNIKLFKIRQPAKYKTLVLATIITVYCTVCTCAGMIVDDIWFTQSDYYSIRILVITFSFYLCFITYLSSVSDFIKISWAFFSSADQRKFYSKIRVFNFFVYFGIGSFFILLILSVVTAITGVLLRFINSATYSVSWFILCYLFIYGIASIWIYMKIYIYIMIEDTKQIFDPVLFHNQRRELLKKWVFNFFSLELFIFMFYGFYMTLTNDYRVGDQILCYYLSVVVVYCVLNLYFHNSRLTIHKPCSKCGYEEQMMKPRTNMLCKICSGYKSNGSKQPVKINAENSVQSDNQAWKNVGKQHLNVASISMGSINSVMSDENKERDDEKYEEKKFEVVNVDEQFLQLFKHNIVPENCDSNCDSLMRIKNLCSVFTTQQAQEFMVLFDKLTKYSLTMLINDYVHLLHSHELVKISNVVGTCKNMDRCPILQSRLRNIDVGKPLLIKTMKQIHCYLYHNSHQMAELRKSRYLDKVNQVSKSQSSSDEELKYENKQEENKQEENKQEEIKNILPYCLICNTILEQLFAVDSNILCSICNKNEVTYQCKNFSNHPDVVNLCQQCGLLKFKMQTFKHQQEQKYKQYKYNDYGFGSFIYYDLLRPTFGTFKQELLNNRIYCIKNEQWNDIFAKAIEMIKTEFAKNIFDRKTKHGIGTHHLIAIICYTDYDNLCHNFCESFRRLHDKENDKDVIERHCNNYYHLGKWLNDTIANYGQLVSEFELKLYRGLTGKFLFQSLCTDFNIPTSATIKMEVAYNFTATEGLILELNSKWRYGSSWDRAQCLPVYWISDSGNEMEVLFFGNFNQLRIVNIIFISSIENQTNLRLYLQSIYLFEIICDGYAGDSDANVEYSKLTYQILNILIKSKISQDDSILKYSEIKPDNNMCCGYIFKLFDNICNKREYFTLQGIWSMYWEYQKAENRNELSEMSNLIDLLMESIGDEEIIDSLRCKCNSKVVKKVITKEDWCDGCRDINQTKNTMGFQCRYSHCNYCFHETCAEILVNMKKLLPNAVHQHAKINRLDEIKSNALKIELLKSAGLW